MADPRLHLILLAGGQGTRARGTDEVPKQFRPTGRGLLFAVSLREFLRPTENGPRLSDLVLTLPESWRELVEDELADLPIPWSAAPAGATRTGSTFNAIEVLEEKFDPEPTDLVAVHDAARPFASRKLLDRLVETAQSRGGAVPGLPVADTIVRREDRQTEYLDREHLLAVQTPQIFRWDLLAEAHRRAAREGLAFTDDGGLLAHCGHPPGVVEGDPHNWKVTSHADWQRAWQLLQ